MSVVSKSYAVPFCRYDANTECSNIYIVAFYLITRWIPVGRSPGGWSGVYKRKTEKFPSPFRTPSGTRTLDPLIKSQLLYQLS